MTLFEWRHGKHGLGQEALVRFHHYLCDVWENRERYLEKEYKENEDTKRRQAFFDFSLDGDIKARNYVGVVQFEGRRIIVKPKICEGRPEFNWKHQLLYWLSYCRRIRFPFSFADMSTLDMDDFLELLIYVFAHYTEQLLTEQPYQAYQSLEEETVFLKGRLQLDAYTRNNLITGKWQHFTCQHQPFLFDNQFNRIVRYVAKRLLPISRNPMNREKLEQILFLLDEVSDQSCAAGDCDRVSLNALFSEHQHILDLCKMYLSHQMIDTSGTDSSNFCFMIPMEYVFEDFVFGFLKSHFPRYNFRPQSLGNLAFREDVPVFPIKTDIYIAGKLVLDTKYAFRPPGDDPEAGVGQSHMYQMLAYALRRECAKVILIYPYFKGGAISRAIFQIPSVRLKNPAIIEAITIDILTETIDADKTLKKRLEPLFYSL